MQKRFVLLLLLVATAPTLSLGADSSSGLKYFGYFASTMYGCNARPPYSHTSEIADHSNVAFIGCTDAAHTKQAIDDAACRNMRSIVGIDAGALFSKAQAGSQFVLRSDWKTGLSEYLNALGSSLNNVVAFEPIDEPNLNYSDESKLIEIISELHRLAPGKAILVIYAGGPNWSCAPTDTGWYCWIKNMPALPYYDWVGFDCYTEGHFTCPNRGGASIAQLLYGDNPFPGLKSFLRPDQRIILIPQSGTGSVDDWMSGGNGNPNEAQRTDDQMNYLDWFISKEIDQFYEMTKSDPQIIGMFPFMWQNTGAYPVIFYGTSSFSKIRAQLRGIGKSIVGGSGLPATGCTAAKTAVNQLLLE